MEPSRDSAKIGTDAKEFSKSKMKENLRHQKANEHYKKNKNIVLSQNPKKSKMLLKRRTLSVRK